MSAIRLAEFGWFVFPIAPRSKAPATRHGLLDASRDVEKIAEFWHRHPEHNIGVRCGVESQIVVLDVDGEEGFESLRQLEATFDALPATLSVKTPRGGSHLYFRHPGIEIRNTAGFPGPGLDLRGAGGFVVAPPSLGANGRRYEVDEQVPLARMPEWLANLLVSRQASERSATSPDVWVEMLCSGIPDGERNVDLARLTGYLLRRWIDYDVVRVLVHLVNEHCCKPPKPPAEVDRTIESIARRELRRRHERAR
jgi:hypothetical protein